MEKSSEFSPYNSSLWFTDRLPRGSFAHEPEQKAAKLRTCNKGGCNVAQSNSQYSGSKSHAPEGTLWVCAV